MYITRFSHRLDFGDKTHDVSVTAMRLVSRMKRDWIHTGRRPSGLCGAALLVAARLHGFNCELNDVVKVVKIGHETIRKRLSEFESTPSSQLTINEFMNIDLEAEHDPPAFYNGRIKPKIQQLEAEAGGMVNIESEIGKLSHEIDGQLAQNTPENHTSRKNANSNSKRALPNGRDAKERESTVQLKCQHMFSHTVDSRSFASRPDEDVDDTETDPDLRVSASFVHSEDPQVLAETFLSPPRPTKHLPSKEPAETPRKFLGPLPTVQSLGLTPLNKERTNRKRSRSDDGELDLDGIDDEEIEKLLLTPRESEIKSRIWNLEFDDFLKEMEAKRAKRLEEEKKKGKPPRKSRPKRKEYYSESKTAGEAIEKLVSRQRLSNKIDYEALRKATAEDDPPAKKDNEQTTLFHLTPFIEPDQLTSVEISPAKLPSVPKKIRKEACLDPTAQEEPEVSKSEVLEVVEEDCKTEIRPATHEEEDYEEEEEDFDDTTCVSASQLMQQAGMSTAGCDEYGYDGDDYY